MEFWLAGKEEKCRLSIQRYASKCSAVVLPLHCSVVTIHGHHHAFCLGQRIQKHSHIQEGGAFSTVTVSKNGWDPDLHCRWEYKLMQTSWRLTWHTVRECIKMFTPSKSGTYLKEIMKDGTSDLCSEMFIIALSHTCSGNKLVIEDGRLA